MSFSLLHPRDQIAATMDRIYGRDMTTTSGGNISVRDENGDVWITPARVDKGSLRAEDIVRVRPDGTREGAHPARRSARSTSASTRSARTFARSFTRIPARS